QLRQRGEQVELLALIDSYDLAAVRARLPDEQQEATRLSALFYRDLLGAAGQPLPRPEEELSRMEPGEMLRELEEAGSSAAAARGIGLEPLRALRRVFESNLRAAWRYVPQLYAGTLTLFEASESSLR